jgi:PAS domain S-box-containing protein
MKLREIKQLLEGTAEAAILIDSNGVIAGCNKAATSFFGLNENDFIGKLCQDVLLGKDECGRNCSETCTVRKRAQNHLPINSYDIQVKTKENMQWCNVSVLIADEASSTDPYTIHIIRPADIQKKLEFLVRDFVVKETNLPANNVKEVLSAKKTPIVNVELTKREVEILQLLANGETSAKVAKKLFISTSTVNNHIQHIMQKLNVKSRLEAIRRAEQTGLI